MPSYSTDDNETFVAGGASPSTINQVFWSGIAGIYFAASDDGLLQSMDGGATWGILRPNATFGTLWPGGSIGYQMAMLTGPRACLDVLTDTCYDMEVGFPYWTIQDFGGGSHVISAVQSHSPVDSFLTSVTGGVDSVQWYQLVSNTDLGPGYIKFWIFPTVDLTELDFDVRVDGDFFFRATYDSSTKFTLSSPIWSTGLDLVAEMWNEVELRFDQTTGRYVSLRVNDLSFDASGLPAESAGVNPGQIEYSFRYFGGASARDVYWDDICFTPKQDDVLNYGVWGGAEDLESLTDFFIIPGTLGSFSTPGDPHDYAAFNGFAALPAENDLLVIGIWLDLGNFNNGAPLVSSPNLVWDLDYVDSPGAPNPNERLVVAKAIVGAGFDFANELITITSGSDNGGACSYSLCSLPGGAATPVQVVTVAQNIVSALASLTFAAFASDINCGLVFQSQFNQYFANFGGSTASSNWEDIIGTHNDPADDWTKETADGLLGPFGAFHVSGDDLTVTFTKDNSANNRPWLLIGLEISR